MVFVYFLAGLDTPLLISPSFYFRGMSKFELKSAAVVSRRPTNLATDPQHFSHPSPPTSPPILQISHPSPIKLTSFYIMCCGFRLYTNSKRSESGKKMAVWRIQDVYPRSRILIFTHPGSRISDHGSKKSNERQG